MTMNVLNTINLTNVSSGAGGSNAKVSRSGDALASDTRAFPAVGEQLPPSPDGEEQALVTQAQTDSDVNADTDELTKDNDQSDNSSDSLPSSWLSSLFILPTAVVPTAADSAYSSVGDMTNADRDMTNADLTAQLQPLVSSPVVDETFETSPVTASVSTEPAVATGTSTTAVTNGISPDATLASNTPMPAPVAPTVRADSHTVQTKTSSANLANPINSLLQGDTTLQTLTSNIATTVAVESTVNTPSASNGLSANMLALSMAVQQQLKSTSTNDTQLSGGRIETPAANVSAAQLTPSLETHGSANVQRQPIASDAAIGQQLLNVLKDRVQMQLDTQQQVAQIRLDPPRLGSIDVRISVEGDRTIVHLNASQATVRDAMATTAEQLRTTLMNKLGSDVTVFTNSDPQGQSSQPQPQYIAEQIDSNSLVLDDEPLTQAHQQQGWINRLA
ncbi:flagellar hook-length control protein FliK [Shewanella sp.]|uniref:flagellar hook-length control protein FliK n=1 Tax=Shewanella sp. TaxID=50422 RepID=UPI003A979E5B